MKKQLFSSTIFGTITAPVSKSVMQRALVAALLDHRKVILHNIGQSNDDVDTTKIIEKLGAKVEYYQDKSMKIKSDFNPETALNNLRILNFGESGLAARLFTPIVALMDHRFVLEGEGSLPKRHLGIPEEIFPAINVKFGSRTGRLPFRVKGPLTPANIKIKSIPSSQFLSGLLFAYSHADACDVTIEVEKVNSFPYIDLSLKVMEDFGMKVPENKNYQSFYFPAEPHFHASESTYFDYTIENDWSNAAMMFVAGATAGEVRIGGLDLQSKQGDKIILEILKKVGADISESDGFISVRKNELKPFEFDATDFPDLFPPLVALAANCAGESIIYGVERLRSKESNRAKSLQYEFSRLGIKVELKDNKMMIKGGTISGGNVKSHNDHRVAMALAIAALNATGRVELGDADAVNKSYPYFFADLVSLNATIS